MNIIEVLNLEPGTKVIDNERNVFYLADGNIGIVSEEKYLDYKNSFIKEMYLENINKTLANREFEIFYEYKKGDKVYIDWFYDTEGLDKVEFLCYCPDGIFAQVLIKTEEKYLIREVEIKNIFKHK